ncbi:hypothetical protein [Methylobacterium sp. 285MFTsu5.1]|uniref:hypothetical protein n=1 Tax=Methylobacterium sp. 285MFTsu5.1 TaxID=1172187 RepID=UPI00035D054D|nr:hypothetical protein [Methylobacterium sp. 285MFTsu5.1]
MASSQAKSVSTSAADVQQSNTAPLLGDLLTRAGNLGTAEGQGANSRPELAMEVAKAAAEGWIQPNYANDKSTDVHKIWEAFGDARTQAKHDGGKDRGDTNTNSFKAQVSKLNAIAKCGALALKGTPVDGFDTLSRAREILRGNTDTKLSAYDALVLIARKQVEQGESPLTNDEIKEHVSPNAKAEETDNERELRVLSASLKTLEKLKDGTEELSPRPSPELDSAIENMRARVSALQFTVKVEAAQVERDRELALQAQRRAALTAQAA